jgi:hypothetical protein
MVPGGLGDKTCGHLFEQETLRGVSKFQKSDL